MHQPQKMTNETRGVICSNQHPYDSVNLGCSPKALELQSIFPSEDFRKDTLQKVNCKYSTAEHRSAKTKVTEALPSPAEESKFPEKDGPIFFSGFYKEAGVVKLWFRRECIQKHPQAWLGAVHIPGKFSGRKSLWKRVGVYSTVSEAFQNHEWVSIRGQSSIGWELSLLVAYLWQALKCG